MELNAEELRAVYDSMIRPIGHPDPIGFIARALLTSEGDPDYIDINGKMGFIPLDPERAMTELGVTEVQSLEGNISAALAMDIQNIQRVDTLEEMVVLTHDGESAPSAETKQMLEELPQAKEEVHALLFPPLASVEDVIKLLRDTDVAKPSKTRMNFFKELLHGK